MHLGLHAIQVVSPWCREYITATKQTILLTFPLSTDFVLAY